MNDDDVLELDEWNFVPIHNVRTHLLWSGVGGAVLLGGSVLGFIIAVTRNLDTFTMHTMTTLPAIAAFAALGYSWRLYRLPRSVTVSSSGLTVERGSGEQTFPWDEIGWSNVEEAGMTMQRQLVVYDVRAKKLARLTEAFGDFNTLVELVKSHVDAGPESTKDYVRLRKAKRTGLLLAVIGPFMILGGAAVAWDTHDKQRQERLLTESGVLGGAEIVGRHLAPNGVTARLEYRVTSPDGKSATRNAEVERAFWDGMEGMTTVPVIYVPEEPAISRLYIAEVPDDDPVNQPVMAYLMSVAASGFGLFLIVAGFLSFFGWDAGFDSETKKFFIRRIGAGR